IKNQMEEPNHFLAEVEFGNPKTKDCRNFGICRIHAIGKTKYNNKESCQGCTTIAKITVFNRHHVAMDFLQSHLPAHVYQKYFSTNAFLVNEDYQYTSEDGTLNFTIPKGRYPIRKKSRLFKVIFKVVGSRFVP
ncbi:MAG: hypothetical protein AAF960_21065, partial [Bacteroidota bacterium]